MAIAAGKLARMRTAERGRYIFHLIVSAGCIGVFLFSLVNTEEPALPAIASSPEIGETPNETERSADGIPGPLGHPREFQIGGYWGVPYTHRADVELKREPDIDLTTKGVGWDGLPAKSPIYYGWRLTQWLGPSPFGGMIDFTHNKTLARKQEVLDMKGTFRGEAIDGPKKVIDVYRKFELSHGHNTLVPTGLLRLPFARSSASPYVGAGVGIAIPHFEIHIQGDEDRTYEYQWVGWAAQILGGFEFRVAEKVSLFLEYKLVFAPVRGTLKSKGGGFLGMDLWSHQVVGGVNFRFAKPLGSAS